MQIVSDFFKNWINPYFSSVEEPLPVAKERAPLQHELDTAQQVSSESEQIPNPILEEMEREAQLEGATEEVPAELNKDLYHNLALLRTEALIFAQARVKEAYSKAKMTRQSLQEINELYQLLVDGTESTSGVTLPQTDGIRAILHRARGHGISIQEGKYVFTKEEKNVLLQKIERKNSDLDTDLKLHIHEVTESSKAHDLVLQALKTLEDKLDQTRKKISEAMRG